MSHCSSNRRATFTVSTQGYFIPLLAVMVYRFKSRLLYPSIRGLAHRVNVKVTLSFHSRFGSSCQFNGYFILPLVVLPTISNRGYFIPQLAVRPTVSTRGYVILPLVVLPTISNRGYFIPPLMVWPSVSTRG